MPGVLNDEREHLIDVDSDDATEVIVEQQTGMPAPSVLPQIRSQQQELASAAADPAPSPASAPAAIKRPDIGEQTGPSPIQGQVESTAKATGQPSVSSPAASEPAPVHEQLKVTADEQPDLSSSMPAHPRTDIKAASAPVTPAHTASEQDLQAPNASAAAFAALGRASSVPRRPASAPTKKLQRKHSPAPAPDGQATGKESSPVPAMQVSPHETLASTAKEVSPKGRPASSPRKRQPPPVTPSHIPSGKVAELGSESSPSAKRARQSPPEPAAAAPFVEAAGAKAAAASPAARAKAARLRKRAKEPSKLQLNSVPRRRLTRSGAGAGQSSASPPAESAAQLRDANSLPADMSPMSEQAPGSMLQPEQRAPAAQAAGAGAEEPLQATVPTERPAREAAGSKAAQPPVLAVKAEKRGAGPMAYLLDKQKTSSPRVTAIAAPRPAAATDLKLSRLTDSSQESVLTGVTPRRRRAPRQWRSAGSATRSRRKCARPGSTRKSSSR